MCKEYIYIYLAEYMDWWSKFNQEYNYNISELH